MVVAVAVAAMAVAVAAAAARRAASSTSRTSRSKPMNTSNNKSLAIAIAALLTGAVLLSSGCAKKAATPAQQSSVQIERMTFATPEAAVEAFIAAARKDGIDELRKVLGSGTDDLLASGDSVADAATRARFLASYDAKHSLSVDADNRRTLVIGDNDWPVPIPIVQADGKWYLDGAAGADEIVYRRVGSNELGAIDVCRGIVDAQREYAAAGHDGDPAGIYALKLISDNGMHNGLYWPTSDAEPASPAGPFVTAAAAEGYRAGIEPSAAYHGYKYRLLFAQGPNAKGGAREYFRKGLLTQGFAVVAWPADYGASGVKTFIVNQDGLVYEKDLGEDTAGAVDAMKRYDPDSSWTLVPAAQGTTAAAG